MHAAKTPPLDEWPLVRFGIPDYVQAASPAVATAFVQKIDGAHFTRLVTLFVRLVTDANVAERQVFIEYSDAEGNTFAVMGAPVTQSASSTNDYAFQGFLSQVDWPVNDTILAPLLPLILLPTFDFRIGVDGVQVGDQLSRVRYVRERFFTDSPTPGLTWR